MLVVAAGGAESLEAFEALSLPYILAGIFLVAVDLFLGGVRNHIFIRKIRPGTGYMLSFRANVANMFMGRSPLPGSGGPGPDSRSQAGRNTTGRRCFRVRSQLHRDHSLLRCGSGGDTCIPSGMDRVRCHKVHSMGLCRAVHGGTGDPWNGDIQAIGDQEAVQASGGGAQAAPWIDHGRIAGFEEVFKKR